MDTCIITGTLSYSNGDPLIGARIYAIPENSPAVVTTSSGAISIFPIYEVTSTGGTFEITLVQNISFNITIKEIGLITTITVPAQDTANLFSLISATEQGDPTPTDSGGEDVW
jgi:hypothetical protein